MTAFTDDGALEGVGGRHRRACDESDAPDRHGRPDVEADDLIDAVHDSLSHHFLGTTRRELLGVLKNESHFAAELVTMTREQGDQAEGHRGMTVVSAGVHGAVGLRPILDVIVLVNGERVDVSANGEHRTGATGEEARHHAGLGRTRDLEVADLLQHLPDESRGFVLVERDFGSPVQRPAPVDDLGCELLRLEQQGSVEGRRMSGSRHGHGSGTGGRGRFPSDVTAFGFFA